MKTLLLMRHAKSSWDDASLADFDRPLAARGIKAGRRMAAWLAAERLQPDLVLCSPAQRCRQTWELLAPKIGSKTTVAIHEELYLADDETLLSHIHAAPEDSDCLLLLTHNPGTLELALQLATGGDPEARARMAEKFPTAALAVLECDVNHWRDIQAGTLTRFVRPRALS